MTSPDIDRRDATRWRAAALVSISGLAVLIAGAPLAGGVLAALVFGVALDAPCRKLSGRVGRDRAVALLTIACALLVFVPALAIGHASVAQLHRVVQRDSDGVALRDVLPAGGAHAGEIATALDSLKETVRSSISRVALSLAGSAARGMLNVIVALLTLYFVLLSGDTLWSRVRDLLPFSAESSDGLALDMRRVTKGMLLGTLLSAALQGASMSIGFLIAGLDGAVFWGVVTGFASMVPVIGSAIVSVPAALLLLARGNTSGALVIVAFGWLLPDVIDKLTRATVSRRFGNVHPLTTLLGALIGVPLFGMVGLVAGPLMIALFIELLQIYQREYGMTASPNPDETRRASLSVTEAVP